jgi:virulence factor Mce-like protein
MGAVVIDHPVPILVVALIGLILWWAAGTRTQDHKVKAAFPVALNLFKGQDVQVDGIDVGKIGKVEEVDGQAIVELGINKKDWPLHEGTTAMVRYGTTLGNGTRYIQLNPGPKKAPELEENQVIPASANTSPTEFDEMFNTFDARTRADVKSFVKATGDAFDGRSAQLNRGLEKTAPGLEETSGLLEDLGEDEAALRGVVANGDRATRVLGGRRPEISNLVTVMAATFDEFASKSQQIRASLDRFAPTLQDVRGTLPRVDQSVDKLDGLVGDLAPGARALPAFVKDTRPALAELSTAAPLATSTLKTLRRSAPGITRLLNEGQPFSDRLASSMAGFAPHLACVRPYAPDIAGFFTHWSSWSQGYDTDSHYARINVTEGHGAVYKDYPEGIKTADFLKTLGRGLKYAMPQPPGFSENKPYFLPECGAGPDALDPKKDPEDLR